MWLLPSFVIVSVSGVCAWFTAVWKRIWESYGTLCAHRFPPLTSAHPSHILKARRRLKDVNRESRMGFQGTGSIMSVRLPLFLSCSLSTILRTSHFSAELRQTPCCPCFAVWPLCHTLLSGHQSPWLPPHRAFAWAIPPAVLPSLRHFYNIAHVSPHQSLFWNLLPFSSLGLDAHLLPPVTLAGLLLSSLQLLGPVFPTNCILREGRN